MSSLKMSDPEGIIFDGLATSLEIRTAQKAYRFPTYADYEACLINQGACVNECDLRSNEALVRGIHRHWHRQGQTGCWFAQEFSKTMNLEKWRAVVISAHRAVNCRQIISREVEDAIAASDCEALSIIFPRLNTLSELLDLIGLCRSIEGWMVGPPDGTDDIAGIQIKIPLQHGCSSWVLGFGPFNFLPITRRAPFTELAVRTKPAKQPLTHDALNTDIDAAHLADIPSHFTQDKFNKCMANTAAMKRRLLQTDDHPTARAKVTFAIPDSTWQKIK